MQRGRADSLERSAHPEFREVGLWANPGGATDIFAEDSGSCQVQGQVPGTAIRGRVQIQRRFSGAEVRVREGAMVTPGSFKRER